MKWRAIVNLLSKIPDSKIIFTGLYIYPVAYTATIEILKGIADSQNMLLSPVGYLFAALPALIPSAVLTAVHAYQYFAQGRKNFSIRSVLDHTKEISGAKRTAMYPEVPQKYLSTVPDGVILGKKFHRYVRIDIAAGAKNFLILGPPGSGKTVTLLASLIHNFDITNAKKFQLFAIDIKGEIHAKSVPCTDPDVEVIDPTDRSAWGWDPYAGLTPDMDPDELEDRLKLIVTSLIVADDPKNNYFTENARNLLLGLLSYYYSQGKTFADSMLHIVQDNLAQTVSDAVELSESGSITRRYLGKFREQLKKGGDSIRDIETTMRQSLSLFSKHAMLWAMRDTPLKASPDDLDHGKSIFLCIPQDKLDVYAEYFRLIVSQMLYHLQTRREGSAPLLMVLDELPALKKIDLLQTSLATLRSRGVSVMCVIQSYSQLRSIYGKDDAQSIFDLCQEKVVLNCDDTETGELFSKAIGDYDDAKPSINYKGVFLPTSQGYSESKDRRHVVEVSDLMKIKETGEVVLLLEGTYLRVKKVEYWHDHYLAPIADTIRVMNKHAYE